MIIWLFGQPCSGKTTLANLLVSDSMFNGEDMAFKTKPEVVCLDGDVFRVIYGNTGYDRSAREKNISRAAAVARYLESTGKIVICSFVTPYRSMRDEIASICPGVKMVFLEYEGVRGREDYHVKDFENPENENCLILNTSENDTEISIEKIRIFCR